MKKIKLGSDALISGGLIVLTVAQLLLGNKKEAKAREAMKKEIISEVFEDLNK